MQPMETVLGRFGARFTLHFLPFEGRVRLSPLGKYYDNPYRLRLGCRVNGRLWVLPFCPDKAEYFPELDMELSMTGVKFRAFDRAAGLQVSFSFRSPFWPRDERLSGAPFFYLDAEVEAAPAGAAVEIVAGLELEAEQGGAGPELFEQEGLRGLLRQESFRQETSHWGPHPAQDSLSGRTFEAALLLAGYGGEWRAASGPAGRPELAATLQAGDSARLLLATYLDGPALEIKGRPYCFKYTRYFDGLAAVARFAVEERTRLVERSERFDRIFADSSTGKAGRDMLAFAFQSYLINTWLAAPLDGSPGADWFSVWEGNCTFHSTVDVEYNLAWFYLLVWPELLETTLAEWRGYLQADERGVWLSHDIGALLGANGQVYWHPMEVEENCNFVLLAYALWRFTGQTRIAEDNRETVARLIRFVLDSDTTGNGLPDRGTANTVDDASPAVQFGREQIYLAVKALAACWAAALLLGVAGADLHNELIKECRARTGLINRTLQQEAWLGDHFAVTLDRSTAGLVNPWSGEALPPGELAGWDAATLYTSNGLLLLLATTPPGQMPDLDLARFRQDIAVATRGSMTEYGCTHSSFDRSHVWVSQNLWRDFVAAYLGLDHSDMAERYWAFQQRENGPWGRGGCFVDTYGGNHLRYYPRGLTAVGALFALAGARLDRPGGTLSFRPARLPWRVPLLFLADWESGRVPEAAFRLEGGQVKLHITEQDLVARSGLRVELEPQV